MMGPDDPGDSLAMANLEAALNVSGHLFSATRRLRALDHFRTPYAVCHESTPAGLSMLRARADGPVLLWPDAMTTVGRPRAAMLHRDPAPPVLLLARVTDDRRARIALSAHGDGWRRRCPITGLGGEPLGSVWRHEDGSVYLPFDPDEVQLELLSARRHELLRDPGRSRGWRRRRHARGHARASFPRWPIEPALHDFLDLLHLILESIAGEPVPGIAAWPDGRRWALVLTHQVETQRELTGLNPVLAIERSLGIRSSWSFAPRRYDVTLDQVERLLAAGCEVGAHGITIDDRACAAWLPFFHRAALQLPMTMPQDRTVFMALRHRDERAWVHAAQRLRSRGGMALLNTHLDCLVHPRVLGSYRRLLERCAGDLTVWAALPREVDAWWRRRAESTLTRAGNGWSVVGPAAGPARIEFRHTGLEPRLDPPPRKR